MAPGIPSVESLNDPESLRYGARLMVLAQAMAATDEVKDFAATGWLPDSFFDLLTELYATYDAFIAHNISASALKIQCRFGCTRCCHQAVHGVYSFEVIHLYRQLRALPEYVTSTILSLPAPTSFSDWSRNSPCRALQQTE